MDRLLGCNTRFTDAAMMHTYIKNSLLLRSIYQSPDENITVFYLYNNAETVSPKNIDAF
jgi:hypothetical protein